MGKSLLASYDVDIVSQVTLLQDILTASPVISRVLDLAPKLDLPNWYLGAGVIAQTVWNHHHGFAPETGIKDCDLVYFDSNLSAETENAFKKGGFELFKNLPAEVEITNEARVHLWYEKEFGFPLKAYTSCEDAINTWPTTATSVGVRRIDDQFTIYAPYGLHDLLNMIVRANKTQITEAIYLAKVEHWRKVWPELTIIPW